ncbi:NAD(P)-binding protein [Argonema antarcticum]|uniref:NAD(P)-binding protein n=1 Tax=Argonema antarcticum TaxID=2942763 RepID=UPI0020125161|nr:NAD(P)-binding protein [Argonema antarcticum]MCL1473370.1 NAD(P)-binding protein [Argonema antarcticum A004/B2]
MDVNKVCIIGAGSSGIATAKILHDRQIPFDCFEKGSGIGGNWRYNNDNAMSSAYKSLHINTSRYTMCYSDFPMPEDYPDFPHHSQVLACKAGLPSVETMKEDIAKEEAAIAKRYINSKRHRMQVDFYPYVYEVEKEMKQGRLRPANAALKQSVSAI